MPNKKEIMLIKAIAPPTKTKKSPISFVFKNQLKSIAQVPNPITTMIIGINRNVKKTFLFSLLEIKPIRPTKNITTKTNPRNIKNSIF